MLLNAMTNELQQQALAGAILSGQVKTNKWESVMIFSFITGHLLSSIWVLVVGTKSKILP